MTKIAEHPCLAEGKARVARRHRINFVSGAKKGDPLYGLPDELRELADLLESDPSEGLDAMANATLSRFKMRDDARALRHSLRRMLPKVHRVLGRGKVQGRAA